ncbi:MAG: PP2C family protein-serine/threonine phosphatase, partial [bacterium]
PYDLVILDVMMPEMSGLDVLEVLRQAHAMTDLPIIMASALDESGDVVKALALGANDYVTKPIDFPILLARIRTQLALKAAVDRVRRLEVNLAVHNQELSEANQKIGVYVDRMQADLRAAARIQRGLLPSAAPEINGVEFAWTYRPCEELAGDLLNIVVLDERTVALYVLDVSGHGVAAALLAVSLNQLLSAPHEPHSLLVMRDPATGAMVPTPPVHLASELNRLFPMEQVTAQYFTLLYGLLDVPTGRFRYVSAGHPDPIIVTQDSVRVLEGKSGAPIGFFSESDYQESELTLNPGDRLYLYSDGLTEAGSAQHDFFGEERVQEALQREQTGPLDASLARLVETVEAWCDGHGISDDLTALALQLG